VHSLGWHQAEDAQLGGRPERRGHELAEARLLTHADIGIRLRPLYDWVAKYQQAINDRLDRMDDYLEELQRRQGEQR
jgi:hypothetical protein